MRGGGAKLLCLSTTTACVPAGEADFRFFFFGFGVPSSPSEPTASIAESAGSIGVSTYVSAASASVLATAGGCGVSSPSVGLASTAAASVTGVLGSGGVSREKPARMLLSAMRDLLRFA